jgi:hypothetical protein
VTSDDEGDDDVPGMSGEGIAMGESPGMGATPGVPGTEARSGRLLAAASAITWRPGVHDKILFNENIFTSF